MLHLSRPGNQTRVILLAVGLGAFFIVGVRSLQASLLDEFSVQTAAEFARHVSARHPARAGRRCGRFSPTASTGAGEFQLIPVLRGRVGWHAGKETNLSGAEEVRQRGVSIGREFTLTYRAHLEANERVLEGAFWTETPSAEPEVSVERQIAERARIHVGDTMRFDILGRTISARVTSIRNVEWQRVAERRLRVRVPARCARPGAADLRVAAQGAGVSRRRGAVPARSRGAVSQRVGDRFPRDARSAPRRHVERSRWRSPSSAVSCCSAAR